MLQWTGGSRRKVATTRKSTYNRQKQYFEQKKRQQTCTSQNYEYGKKKRIHDSEGPRSLDVLNLKNLTSAPQCCSNDHNGDNIPQLVSDVPKSLPAFCSNTTFPLHCYQPAETRSLSNSHYKVQTQNNLDKQQSTRIHCDKVGVRFEERKTQITSNGSNPIKYGVDMRTADENHVSVLDLLNDDGCKNNSSVSSSHESHVAFSVEGLGKIGIETPVRSPMQTVRVSFGDLSSHSKSSRWINTSEKDEFVPDDIGIEFDLGKSPSNFLGKSDIVNTHSNTLTSLNFRKDGALSDVFSNLTSKTSFGKRRDIYKPALCRNEGTHKDRFCLLSEENNKATWKDESFYINNDPLAFMEDKKSEMHINEFEDIHWWDRRNTVEAHEVSGISEQHASSFNHLRSVKDQDLMSFDWERYPSVNLALHFENTTEPFYCSFPDTKDVVNNLNFQSDEYSSFLTTAWHEGTSSSRSKSMNLERNNHDRQNNFWIRSDKEYGAENIPLEKIKYDKLDDIGNNLEGMWMNIPSQKKPMQSNCWKKLDCWPSFEEGFDIDLLPSPLPKTSQIDGAFFDNGILSKDDPLDVFQDSTVHHPIDFSHRISKPNVGVNQDTPDEFFSENHCKRQKSGPINLMKAPAIYPFKANDEHESNFLFSSEDHEVNKFPYPSIRKNLDKDNDDSESGFLSTTCHENSQEEHVISSIGESDFSSKTLRVLGSADNRTKDEEPKGETPEGLSRSDSPKAFSHPQSVGTPIVTTEEALKNQESVISNASNEHIGSAPASLPGGDEGKETLNMNEGNVGSKELGVGGIKPSGSGEPAYQVMLESYVLQLLCVQKVLMNSSVHDKEKKI